ncbi:flagellar basal-body MS-ring/collar protein FliF [Heliophilum fasciatum]|uniref:Flagellar M-ring protein n=1 Tax=Heliophilum fasciatum TaxID=35700 RepID=A0A4R2RZF5_9FIRM|nr:flagellar basal-body MS-ring/collar protein FliF [Heliophilum fasciatum]MCW2277945.1 flagellar M-ring protein FliF [Heliophilum fasciatum]TCP64485.1 flagellar M-ring protein FliF [Heliophilum fasciatum]
MNELFEQIRSQLSELLGRFSLQQKLIIGGSVLTVLIALGGFVFWAGQPDYVPLYPKLDPADAGAIRAKLLEAKVDFKIPEDGSTILVPAKDQANLRLELANAQLPKGSGWGFETFNESRFSETDKERDIRLKVATETELARTLQNVPGVENARVMIVPAQDALFKTNASEATASVMLVLKPYTELEPKQIQGIIHLVSRSVKSLKPENVTVTDHTGTVLSDGLIQSADKPNLEGLTSQQIAAKREFEKYLEQKAQDMLNRVVGPGNGIVKVATELDFSQSETKGSQYGKPVGPLSQREIIESGTGSSSGGTPGTNANIPTQQSTATGTSNYSKTDITTNNEIPKTETFVVTPPGSTIKRLSVSVIVNRDGLTPEETQKYEQAVAQAVGIQYPIQQPLPGQVPARVEQVSVVGMAFDRTQTDELNRIAEQQKMQQLYIWIGVAVAALLFLSGAGYLGWRAYQRKQAAARAEAERLAALMPPPPPPPPPPIPAPVVELTPEEKRKQELRDQLDEISDTNPEAIARLIKTWMNDEMG